MEEAQDVPYTPLAPQPAGPRRVFARATVTYVVVAGYLTLLAIAAIVSIQVGMRILDAASEAQTIIHKAQVVFSVLYSFACTGNASILSQGECDALSFVI